MSKLFTEETRYLHFNQRLDYSAELAKKLNFESFDYPITNRNVLDSKNIIENEIRKITYESCICIFTIPSIDFDKILVSYPFFADYLKFFFRLLSFRSL